MRRLVVISNSIKKASIKKSKGVAALVAITFLLTSIHLAAAARIETLKRQQEQWEQESIRTAQALLRHSGSSFAPAPKLENAAMSHSQPASTTLDSPSATQIKKEAALLPATTVAQTRQIVISIADRQLAVLENGHVLKIYPIAVGTRSTPSPDGDFVVINHAKDPIYRHADKEIAPGKDNPLGSRWMGLSLKGYGIHGTNVQSSVGKAASHGCFRMRKHDVEELYGLVHVGDVVTIHREHDALMAKVFDVPGIGPATSTVAAERPANSEVQMAAASEATTVETSAQ